MALRRKKTRTALVAKAQPPRLFLSEEPAAAEVEKGRCVPAAVAEAWFAADDGFELELEAERGEEAGEQEDESTLVARYFS
ncbi:MAG: hypothetical protein KatS3mg131_1613 [Candidatus Tectimicrobiota bacterium]|nr:MAG: hypothetical protein KatS3mg131_1613 [Candidatus Tectomicrobia bacterium]